MNKILIIEDEMLCFSRLKRLLAEIDNTIEVVGPLLTVDSVIETLKGDEDFDLIISDIRLRDSLVFEAFREVMPAAPVVFVTAYDEYALTAFRNNGIDYLLKPVDRDELKAALNKVLHVTGRHLMDNNLRQLMRDNQFYRERILVAKGNELIPIRTADIAFVRKEDRGIVTYTKDGNSYKLSMSMNELEEQLSPVTFFRLNRQYIAQIDSIQKISFSLGSKLLVRLMGTDDEDIVVSKEKSTQFKQWLDR